VADWDGLLVGWEGMGERPVAWTVLDVPGGVAGVLSAARTVGGCTVDAPAGSLKAARFWAVARDPSCWIMVAACETEEAEISVGTIRSKVSFLLSSLMTPKS
jgi:hypothetical protein